MGKLIDKLKNRLVLSVLGMIVGSTIYAFAVVFILDKGSFYAGGITGIAQIISNALKLPYVKSIIITGMNLPLFIIGWRSVSKRFAILSLISVIYQSIIIYLFTYFVENDIFDPFAFFYPGDSLENLDSGKLVVLAVFGGMMSGLGCGIVLRSGSSTGGMDIISQSFQMKAGLPFVYVSATVDVLIILAGTIVGMINGIGITSGIFTIIRLIISIVTLDKVYTIYKYQKLTIISDKHEEIRDALVKSFPHGITILKGTGGYSHGEKMVFEIVILTYELNEYMQIIKNIDPNAFAYHISVKGISGNYTRKTIT